MKSKEEKEKNVENTDTDQNINESDQIKELEKQITYLQIENAYLKELRRLRLEETRQMKKQQESFTASEENLN